MKKAKIICAVMLSGLMLFGCVGGAKKTSTFDPGLSSVFVSRDGKLSSAIVENCDKDYYNQDELKTFIEDAASKFNAEHGTTQDGEAAVAVKSCSVSSGKAKVVFDYASPEMFTAFSEENHDMDNQLKKVTFVKNTESNFADQLSGLEFTGPDGKQAEEKEFTKDIGKSDVSVFIAEGSATVQTEGKILYVSDGCVMKDEFTVSFPEGKHAVIFR